MGRRVPPDHRLGDWRGPHFHLAQRHVADQAGQLQLVHLVDLPGDDVLVVDDHLRGNRGLVRDLVHALNHGLQVPVENSSIPHVVSGELCRVSKTISTRSVIIIQFGFLDAHHHAARRVPLDLLGLDRLQALRHPQLGRAPLGGLLIYSLTLTLERLLDRPLVVLSLQLHLEHGDDPLRLVHLVHLHLGRLARVERPEPVAL